MLQAGGPQRGHGHGLLFVVAEREGVRGKLSRRPATTCHRQEKSGRPIVLVSGPITQVFAGRASVAAVAISRAVRRSP